MKYYVFCRYDFGDDFQEFKSKKYLLEYLNTQKTNRYSDPSGGYYSDDYVVIKGERIEVKQQDKSTQRKLSI